MNGGIVSATLVPSSRIVVGAVEVLERERQPAVDAEGAVAGGGGRRHAVPAVVVDAARAEREPGELAELVGLLVGEAAAAEHADRVAPCSERMPRRAVATRSSASSQLASWNAPSAPQRGAPRRWGGGAARPRSSPSCTARRGSWGSRGRRPSRAGVAASAASVRREGHRALQGAVRAVRVGGTVIWSRFGSCARRWRSGRRRPR